MTIRILNGNPNGFCNEIRSVILADLGFWRKQRLCHFPQNDYPFRNLTVFLSLLHSLARVQMTAGQGRRKALILPFAQVFTEGPVLKRRYPEVE